MERNSLRQQIASMRQLFFDEEVLNEQFVQLEKLEELDSPNFVEEVLTIYFDESAKLITDVEQELNKTPKDFLLMERILHQFKGSSASVGANKVTAAINHLRGCLKERNLELSNAAFQQMKREQDNLKNKLEAYFELKGQVPDSEEGQGSNE